IATDIWRVKAGIERAWAYLTEALDLARTLGAKKYLAMAYRLLAQLRIADQHRRLPALDQNAPDIEPSFAEGLRLAREAHSEDELALSWLAYGQYLAAARRVAEARAAFIQAQNLGTRCGMLGLQEQLQQALQSLPAIPAALLPGQQRVLLA